MKTLKLYTSDGKALTDLQSTDESISLPHQIQILRDGRAVACHADHGEWKYDNLASLCAEYALDFDVVRAQEWR